MRYPFEVSIEDIEANPDEFILSSLMSSTHKW